MSSGAQFKNFVADGDSPVYSTWGPMYVKLGDDLAGDFGNGNINLWFLGADNAWHRLTDIDYAIAGEIYKELPINTRLDFKLKMSGSVNPNINCHVLCSAKQ